MKNAPDKRTCVIGDNHVNTLGVIRSLGELGYRPIVVVSDEGRQWVKKSRYIDKAYVIEKDPDALLRVLMNIAQEDQKRWVFPCGDFYVRLLDSNYDLLSRYYHLPNCSNKENGMRDFMSKAKMQEIAVAAGFEDLKTKFFCDTGDRQRVDEFGEYYSDSYPLLIRADKTGTGALEFVIVKDEEELRKVLNTEGIGTVLIQKYISVEEELGIQGVSFGSERNPEICGTIHKIRTSTVAHGSTTYAELTVDTDKALSEKIRRFLEAVNYSGIFDIEVMISKNKTYFVECNFRNGAYGYAFSRAGLNLPALWMGDDDCSTKREKLTLMNEISDCRHIRAGNITCHKWIKEFLTCSVYLTLNMRDIKPFIGRFL